MLTTAAGASFMACFAVDRYEAACEPYDYQLKDHFKFAVYSFMVSCCFGCLVTVMFTSLGSHLAVLSTTSCPSPNRVMQSYWWAFELTAGVIVLLLMIRASVRISVQIKYADNNSSGTVRAIAKQGRITTVAALVVVVSVVTGLFPHMAALILTINPLSTYFNQIVLYLGSASALGAALRPIVAITRYRALRSHIGRAFRRHSSNTAVGPHMELFAVERKDRQSVITLY
uniref:G-protein coupled receptors family 1 profile domain-containing protein n=1 Tax=Plectus sambesii TaxID=2011161 RepID=A0A914V6F6_9BILA